MDMNLCFEPKIRHIQFFQVPCSEFFIKFFRVQRTFYEIFSDVAKFFRVQRTDFPGVAKYFRVQHPATPAIRRLPPLKSVTYSSNYIRGKNLNIHQRLKHVGRGKKIIRGSKVTYLLVLIHIQVYFCRPKRHICQASCDV